MLFGVDPTLEDDEVLLELEFLLKGEVVQGGEARLEEGLVIGGATGGDEKGRFAFEEEVWGLGNLNG